MYQSSNRNFDETLDATSQNVESQISILHNSTNAGKESDSSVFKMTKKNKVQPLILPNKITPRRSSDAELTAGGAAAENRASGSIRSAFSTLSPVSA